MGSGEWAVGRGQWAVMVAGRQQQLRPERCVVSQAAHAPPLQGFPPMVSHPQAPVLYRPSEVYEAPRLLCF